MDKEKLIKHYEDNLEKVKSFWGTGKTDLQRDRGADYIKSAEDDLEAVKNGREW